MDRNSVGWCWPQGQRSRLPYSAAHGDIPWDIVEELVKLFLPNRAFKSNQTTKTLSPRCPEQLNQETHGITSHSYFLSYQYSGWSRRVRRKSWSVWERPISSILWSRVSFLLFLSSYHLKDLPNKSIMLNEKGKEWQGLQLRVQNNTADGLDKHTYQGTSCFSLPNCTKSGQHIFA